MNVTMTRMIGGCILGLALVSCVLPASNAAAGKGYGITVGLGQYSSVDQLKSFHDQLLVELNVEKLAEKTIRCFGCDQLFDKGTNNLSGIKLKFGDDRDVVNAVIKVWAAQAARGTDRALTMTITDDPPEADVCIPPYNTPCYPRIGASYPPPNQKSKNCSQTLSPTPILACVPIQP